MRLADKSAVVTGAASGIGAATAAAFAREGADVTIADISDLGEATAERIRQEGGKATFVRTDMTDMSAIAVLIDSHMNRTGRLDILFNGAAREGPGTPVSDTSEEALDEVLAANFKSVFLACKLVGPIMSKAGKGSIINVSAGSAREGLAWPNLGAYIGSKGAVISFTRALATELSPRGVRVNSLNPGVIDTPMLRAFIGSQSNAEAFWDSMGDIQLLKRIGQASEVASAALFLASDDASYVTGIDLLVDGGLVLG
jgi:NAD(P)-dependent dehydrogenase (short-subunit alcohol dehydrogenase family)